MTQQNLIPTLDYHRPVELPSCRRLGIIILITSLLFIPTPVIIFIKVNLQDMTILPTSVLILSLAFFAIYLISGLWFVRQWSVANVKLFTVVSIVTIFATSALLTRFVLFALSFQFSPSEYIALASLVMLMAGSIVSLLATHQLRKQYLQLV